MALSVADAVRFACILEATAPKAGNVYPGKSFVDLSYEHFIAAAEIAAECFAHSAGRFSEKVLRAAEQTRASTDTNVNLGIVLLIGPLAQIAHQHFRTNEPCKHPHHLLPPQLVADLVEEPLRQGSLRRQGSLTRFATTWQPKIALLLREQDSQDAKNIFAAIRLSAPSGLGTTKSMDVHDKADEGLCLIAAMTAAQKRDAVARQYADNFAHLLNHVVPIVDGAIRRNRDILAAITAAQLELLQQEPDTLIARKNGIEVAEQVQMRARQVDPRSAVAWQQFDRYLRSDANRLNPGTTADLIAAALFVLLIDSFTENQSYPKES